MRGTERLILKESVVSPSRRVRRDIQAYPDESVSTQMCGRCPSCIQIRNISEYTSETTPLLADSITFSRDARCYDKVLIYLFICILLFGASIGTYLLILETQGAVIEEFDYISRDSWGVNTTFLKDIPLLHNPTPNILLLELTSNCTEGSKNCLDYQKFFDDNKEKLRIVSGDVLYNFYQDEVGKIFEGRGWRFQSDCGREEGCDDILTIGLIEQAGSPPSQTQIQKLKAFLDYCVMDYALKPCYGILVRQSFNKYFEDTAFTLDEMNKKDGTCEYFN